MSNRIQTALNEICAQDDLKQKTKNTLLKAMEAEKAKNHFNWQKLVLAPVCAVLICAACFGFISYNVEVCAISIDINPSIELGINGYNRVISTKGYNDDGEKLIECVDVKNMKYEDAVAKILECDEADRYLTDDNIVVVTVDSDSDEKSDEMLQNIEKCGNSQGNMYCYKNSADSVEEAHANDVSFGKYNAYLELKKYDPDITVDEIKDMTMREIRDKISQYTADLSEDETASQSTQGAQSQGYGGNSSGQQNGGGLHDGSGQQNGNGLHDGSGQQNGKGKGKGANSD